MPTIPEHVREGATLWVDATYGSDTRGKRGYLSRPFLTIAAAFAAASAGDLVRVGPGTFAQSATALVVPASVAVRGAGMGLTMITSTVDLTATNCCCVAPSTGSVLEDMTIQSLLVPSGTNQYSAPLGVGSAQTAFTGVIGRRLRLVADTDGLYVKRNAACSIDLFDCEIQTKYDGTALFTAAHTVRLFNPRITITGPTASSGNVTRCVKAYSGTLSVYGGQLIASGGTAENLAAYTNQDGTINLFQVLAQTSGTGAADVSNAGVAINVYGGYGSGVNGAFTEAA